MSFPTQINVVKKRCKGKKKSRKKHSRSSWISLVDILGEIDLQTAAQQEDLNHFFPSLYPSCLFLFYLMANFACVEYIPYSLLLRYMYICTKKGRNCTFTADLWRLYLFQMCVIKAEILTSLQGHGTNVSSKIFTTLRAIHTV